MKFKTLLFTGFVIAFAALSAHSQQGPTKTSKSQLDTANKTLRQCNDNNCACAVCRTLYVELPPGATIMGVHCFTNAHYPDDYPHGQFHEVGCTQDNSFSVFDAPKVVTFGNGAMEVRIIFHNRSHDRDRDITATVDWR